MRKKSDGSLDSDSCRQCIHFHERTEARDEESWGECWLEPPAMVPAEDDDGAVGFVPLVRWHFLPYVCGSKKQRLQ